MKKNILSLSFTDMRKLAAQGDVDAQFNLGLIYNNGEGVLRDDTEAFKWFLEAAEQGHAEAQYNLARMYYNGEGVPNDDAQALKWYRKSAGQGHAEALFALGCIQFLDQGNLYFEEAEDWFALISKQKDGIICVSEVQEQELHPAAPPSGRLIVKRNGHSITRQIPKPIVLIDTREKYPFDFRRFKNWIAEEKSQALKAGDYSVEGMETLLILERKTLTDLITTLIQQRDRFFKQCEKMSKYRWKALLIEASYEDIKSPYDQDEYNTSAHPNAVSGTLDALEARYGIPVIYTSLYRPLPEEKAASWLSKHFTYWYLEENGFGRVLQEGDL